jgi:hypothetical protein
MTQLPHSFRHLWRHLRSAPADPPRCSFRRSVEDAEELLSFAAESGTPVAPDVATAILQARTALNEGRADDLVQGRFYEAYTKLAALFGQVTATSIRNCTSASTRRKLVRNQFTAITITVAIATISVGTFVADSLSKKILEDISVANAAAVQIRVGLTEPNGSKPIPTVYAQKDPCTLLAAPPTGDEKVVRDARDVETLQAFSATIRDLQGRALKLNRLVGHVGWIECDPFAAKGTGVCPRPEPARGAMVATPRDELQLNPAILNYAAEALCKIQTFQTVRTFATNVQADYAAIIGAITSFALPIVYAWLGAYAYRLRLFSETIRKRTYHPSFADSARMITAVIAGAIVGLFNPAQGLSLSPLATAFLVGYGVELFFRFLDTLISAFGSGRGAAQPAR